MPFIKVEDQEVYYESHGLHEKTLVILNGIMMSTASWQPFIKAISKSVRVVLVDFFDQGKSAHRQAAYDQSCQEEVVHRLIQTLSLSEVTLLGISYGGEVAMRYAISHGDQIEKLILANTTAYTTHQLKATGDNWINAAKTFDGRQFFKATIPPIYSEAFYESHTEWLEKREALFHMAFDQKWYEGFIRLVRSAESHDVREALSTIKVPTLVIGAKDDLITPVHMQYELAERIPEATFLLIPNCGHAAMYEKPTEFFTAVMGFVLMGGNRFVIG